MHDVVITGVGATTPVGGTYDEILAALLEGRTAVALDPPVEGRPRRAAARIAEDLTTDLPKSQVRMSDRTSLMLIRASDRALADAGLPAGSYEPLRTGVFVGTAEGPVEGQLIGNEEFFLRNTMSGMTVLRVLPNAPASYVSMRHGLRGECATLCCSGASSGMAIASAVRAIRRGELDVALAGGVEGPLSENSARMWDECGLLAPVDPESPASGARAFAGDRAGMVLGEAGVLLVLESAERAAARGARVYARLAGFGMATQAAHVAAPDAGGQLAAMNAALQDARLSAADVDHVVAEGSGTREGDRAEARALRDCLGERARDVPISATKPIHGNLLGAGCAMSVVVGLASLCGGTIAPTIHLDAADPEFDLDFVPGQARTSDEVRTVLVNNYGLGAAHCALVLRRHDA